MKSVITSIQPYYVFLIIARIMGWDIPQEKTVEVRKDFPKDQLWNKKVHIYCSKNRKSFNRIPEQYQPLMEKFLGKVIGKFVCDRIDKYCGRLTVYAETPYKSKYVSPEELAKTCLVIGELNDYLEGKNGNFGNPYFWHISDLKIYDEPKELGEFSRFGFERMGYSDCICANEACKYREKQNSYYDPPLCTYGNGKQMNCQLTRPPQSWCYVGDHD